MVSQNYITVVYIQVKHVYSMYQKEIIGVRTIIIVILIMLKHMEEIVDVNHLKQHVHHLVNLNLWQLNS